jgi:S-adenosylmethionine hydrolase
MSHPIAILTDFGTTDPFVGIMKGVVAGIAPESPTIDLTHEIPPGDIQRGAITLWQSLTYFPKGGVFLAVVDPGVGTHRRPIILETQGFTFVGPDNGLFTFILGDSFQAWELQNPRFALSNPGMTFHGRDLFAPAAGHAALGIPGPEFGEPIQDIERIPLPKFEFPSPGEINGQILHADHFGNLLTSLGSFAPADDGKFKLSPWIGGEPEIEVDLYKSSLKLPNGEILLWASTFGQVPEGECAFILGSSGLIEIAANRKSAANLLHLAGGETISLTIPSKP